jgi:hypothetical protein
MLLVGPVPRMIWFSAGPGQGMFEVSKQEPGTGRMKDADRHAFQNELTE